MLVATIRTAGWLLAASVAFAASPARAGSESPVHRDGFEDRAPLALAIDAVRDSGIVRMAAGEYWAMHLQLAPSLGVLGLDDPYPAGPAQATLQSGLLVLDFGETLAGESLAFAPWLQAGALRWVCGRAPAPVDATVLSDSSSATRTSLPDAWLPDSCRSDPPLALQVEDALVAMAGARLAITEVWIGDGTLPASLAEVGMQDPLPAARARLQLDAGVLVATFVDALEGERLGLAPWVLDGSLHWVCGHAEPPAGATALAAGTATAQTTLDDALLPIGCR